jgi:hypothetical protein
VEKGRPAAARSWEAGEVCVAWRLLVELLVGAGARDFPFFIKRGEFTEKTPSLDVFQPSLPCHITLTLAHSSGTPLTWIKGTVSAL